MNAAINRNKFEAQLDHLVQARERWQESEWVLDCLRSKTASPLKEFGEQEIVEWHRKLGT